MGTEHGVAEALSLILMQQHACVAQGHVKPEERTKGHGGEITHSQAVAKDHDAEYADQNHAGTFKPAQGAGTFADDIAEHHVGDAHGNGQNQQNFSGNEQIEVLFAFEKFLQHRTLSLDRALRHKKARRGNEKHHDANAKAEKKTGKSQVFFLGFKPGQADTGRQGY